MKNSILFLFSFLCFAGVQCDTDHVVPIAAMLNCSNQPQVCTLSTANRNFAIEIFKKIHAAQPAGNNIFISPFSISTALTMTANGGAGQTLDDMRSTLQINGMEMPDVNSSYKTLLQILPVLDPGTTLKLANSVWPRKTCPVLNSFLQTNSDYFNSEIIPVNFDDPAVSSQVNAWVELHTDGLIKNAVGSLSPETVMLLINAIYFKGVWLREFDPDKTTQEDFYTLDGTVIVGLMNQTRQFYPYFENDLFQAVDLPYGDSIFSMSVFLPKPGHDVGEIITALDVSSWEEWLGNFHTEKLNLSIPRFEIEFDIRLKQTLSDMGMGLAFSGAADFSHIVPNGGIKISDVIHKSFMTLDEKGTEAAAVTLVILDNSVEPVIPEVRGDRPFFFVIRENRTNCILFMGKMMNPNS